MKTLQKWRRFLPLHAREMVADSEVDVGRCVNVPNGFFPTNPSLLDVGDSFLVNVRCVNYRYTDPKSLNITLPPGESFKTVNRIVLLDRNLEVVEPLNTINARLSTLNIEDIRLFRHSQRIMGLATMPTAKGSQMVLLGFSDDLTDFSLTVLQSPFGSRIEKNWCPFSRGTSLCCVYAFDPTVLFAIDPITGTLTPIGPATPGDEDPKLNFWDCGSTPGLMIDGRYMVAAHRRKVCLPSRKYAYVNRIYSISTDLLQVQSSKYFSIGPPAIQFLSGMTVTDREVLIAYGLRDQQAIVARFDRARFFNAIGM